MDSQAPRRAVQCLLADRLIQLEAGGASQLEGPPQGRKHPPKRPVRQLRRGIEPRLPCSKTKHETDTRQTSTTNRTCSTDDKTHEETKTNTEARRENQQGAGKLAGTTSGGSGGRTVAAVAKEDTSGGVIVPVR